MGCCVRKFGFFAQIFLSNPRKWGRLSQVRNRSERKNPCDNLSEAGCKSRWQRHSPVSMLPEAARNLSEQPLGLLLSRLFSWNKFWDDLWMFSSSALAFDYVTTILYLVGIWWTCCKLTFGSISTFCRVWRFLPLISGKNICCSIIYLLKPVEAHWSCIGPEVFSDLFQFWLTHSRCFHV